MVSADNETIYRRLLSEVFEQGNLAVLNEIVSPDFVEHEAGAAETNGIAALKGFLTQLHSAFSNMRLPVSDLCADGSQVWARLAIDATHTGPFSGVPATGRQIHMDVFDLCRFADGKMVEHWGIADRLGLMEQLGAIPSPALQANAATGATPSL